MIQCDWMGHMATLQSVTSVSSGRARLVPFWALVTASSAFFVEHLWIRLRSPRTRIAVMIEHFILWEYMSGCMIRTNDYTLREKCRNYSNVSCSLHLLSCVLYRVFFSKHLHYPLLAIITLFKITECSWKSSNYLLGSYGPFLGM